MATRRDVHELGAQGEGKLQDDRDAVFCAATNSALGVFASVVDACAGLWHQQHQNRHRNPSPIVLTK